jgi:hyperosmotically inducible periplasmic protein
MKTQLLKSLASLATMGAIGLMTLGTFQGCAVTSGKETTGEYIDDTVLTSEIKAKLLGNNVFSIVGLHVETFKGAVTLTGTVKNAADKTSAEGIARNTKGVKSVNSKIEIKPVL